MVGLCTSIVKTETVGGAKLWSFIISRCSHYPSPSSLYTMSKFEIRMTKFQRKPKEQNAEDWATRYATMSGLMFGCSMPKIQERSVSRQCDLDWDKNAESLAWPMRVDQRYAGKL